MRNARRIARHPDSRSPDALWSAARCRPIHVLSTALPGPVVPDLRDREATHYPRPRVARMQPTMRAFETPHDLVPARSFERRFNLIRNCLQVVEVSHARQVVYDAL